jgi:hypothetical protein
LVVGSSVCRCDELVRLSVATLTQMRGCAAALALSQQPRSGRWPAGSGHRVPAAVPRARPSVRRLRETRRSTTDPALCKPHLRQLLGFDDMIVLRTRGPPVRYTLEMAEQCPTAVGRSSDRIILDGVREHAGNAGSMPDGLSEQGLHLVPRYRFTLVACLVLMRFGFLTRVRCPRWSSRCGWLSLTRCSRRVW